VTAKTIVFLNLIVIISLLLLSGCWDRDELEDLAMVQALGIDYLPEEEKFEVTLSVIRPADLGAGGMEGGIEGEIEPTRTITTRGDTISVALEQQNAFLPRRTYYAHNDIVIVGETLAKRGLHHILDRLVRERDTRLTLNMFVTSEDVKDLMRSGSRLEMSLPEEIRDMKQRTNQRSLRPEVNQLDFVRYLLAGGRDPYLPLLEVREEEPTSPQEAEIAGTLGEGEDSEQLVKYPHLYGTAVFKEDRLAGFLDGHETKGLLYVEEGIIDSRDAIEDPEGRPGKVVLITISSSSEITPRVENGEPEILVEIVEEGDICCQTAATHIFTMENFRRMEALKESLIKGYVEDALEKVQEWEADIFGFGQKFQTHYPDYWETIEDDWREIYTEMEVIVEVESHIRRTGLIERPPFHPHHESPVEE